MIPFLPGLALMAGSLLVLAQRSEPRTALAGWALLSAVACVLAASAISRQPVGEATLLGRLGSAALRWGFRAGQGKLIWATLISWMVWLLIGATTIAALRVRADTRQLLVVLMLGASGVLWFAIPRPGAKRLALLIAGGPPLLIGGGYALFLLFTLTVGRNARWN